MGFYPYIWLKKQPQQISVLRLGLLETYIIKPKKLIGPTIILHKLSALTTTPNGKVQQA